jgi:hypothetical protein
MGKENAIDINVSNDEWRKAGHRCALQHGARHMNINHLLLCISLGLVACQGEAAWEPSDYAELALSADDDASDWESPYLEDSEDREEAFAIERALAICGTGSGRVGPPTAAELKMLDARIKAAPFTPKGTNKGNNFAYGGAAKEYGLMNTMYKLTGDVWYLDQVIKYADYMLANRNDPKTGRIIWTGKRELCWPNKVDTAPDAAYCGTETGQVAGHIADAAKVIAQNASVWKRKVGIGDSYGYGKTYLDRARTYLREVNRTLDGFTLAYWVDSTKNSRLHIPTHPGYAKLSGHYANDQGHAVPWNQQDMITSALVGVADTLKILGEDPGRVSRYDRLTNEAIRWFEGELRNGKYTVDDVTVTKWGYSPGDMKHIENLAHASADINMIYGAYKGKRFGVERSTLVAIANTFLHVIAKPDGTFASEVDGSGKRAHVSASWMNYEEFQSGVVEKLKPQLRIVDEKTDVNSAIGILAMRKRWCQ